MTGRSGNGRGVARTERACGTDASRSFAYAHATAAIDERERLKSGDDDVRYVFLEPSTVFARVFQHSKLKSGRRQE
jgi:hypothetical protein